MANPPTASLLRRLILSATEVRELTDWPGAMVEDYLNILDDLITLADTIDGKAKLVDGDAGDIPVLDGAGELVSSGESIDTIRARAYFYGRIY